MPIFTIVASKSCPAGTNIAHCLIENFGFKETGTSFEGNPTYSHKDFRLAFCNARQVFADTVDALETDFIIFASTHRSEAGRPTLTAHPIGNWSTAGLGGKDRELVPTSAILIKNYLNGLLEKQQSQKLDYEVVVEQTHHGPFLTKPTVYVEIGSGEKQWNDPKAVLAVAETIMEKTSIGASGISVALGLGGMHYEREFSKLLFRTPFALSHMCPEYALQFFDAEMLEKAKKATFEKLSGIVLHWKHLGKGAEKQRILSLCESSGLQVWKVEKLLK